MEGTAVCCWKGTLLPMCRAYTRWGQMNVCFEQIVSRYSKRALTRNYDGMWCQCGLIADVVIKPVSIHAHIILLHSIYKEGVLFRIQIHQSFCKLSSMGIPICFVYSREGVETFSHAISVYWAVARSFDHKNLCSSCCSRCYLLSARKRSESISV